MTDMPKFVEFHEEGPREGFQIEPVLYPLERRAALIDSLGETGLKQIQVGSFVSPKVVPTMADTAELFGAIKRRKGVEYTALWLNKKGFMLAGEAPRVPFPRPTTIVRPRKCATARWNGWICTCNRAWPRRRPIS